LHEVEVLVSPVVIRRDLEHQGKVEKERDPGSQQLHDDEGIGTFSEISDQIINPPINLRLWASQMARSTRLNRGIRVVARNTVGLGWDVVPEKPFTQDTPATERKRVETEIERIRTFFKSLNAAQPFSNLMECVVIDEEATGNGYLEFVRDNAGNLQYAYHVMSTTIRLLKNDRGFVQIRGGKRKYFKNFGDERVMDARNGAYEDEPSFASAERSEDVNAGLPIENRATELLHFKLYHPMSEFYGLPRFIPAGAAIAGNFHAAKRNVVFFQNDAVPRMAVLVSGGQLDQGSLDRITKMFQEGQGTEQAHRILVLQAVSEGVGVDDKANTRIELRPFTVNVTEDGSFLNYRRVNDEEIRESLGLSEVYFKSEKLTKASAVVAKATTDEQEFEPARLLKEHLINHMIVLGALNAKGVKFVFKRPETTDPVEKAAVHKSYASIGVLTTNEIRTELNKDPLPKEEEWANIPLPIAELAVQGMVTGFSAYAPEPEEEPEETEGPEEEPEEEPESEESEEEAEERSIDARLPFIAEVEDVARRVRGLPALLGSRAMTEEN